MRFSFEKDWLTLLSFLAACLGPFMFGVCLGFAAPSLPAMTIDNKLRRCYSWVRDLPLAVLDEGEVPIFASFLTVGAFIGSFGGGPVMERIGRKWVMVLASPLHFAGFIWIAFAVSPVSLTIARVLTGIGHGLTHLATNAYIAEIAPTRLRGPLNAAAMMNITLGLLFSIGLGSVIRTGGFCDWRVLSICCSVPGALLGICMFFCPLSPRWLASNGNLAKAKIELRRLRRAQREAEEDLETLVSHDGDELTEELKTLNTLFDAWIVGRDKRQPSFRQQLQETFSGLSAAKEQLLIATLLHVFAQASGLNAVTFYQVILMKKAHVDNPQLASTLAMVCNFCGSLASIFLVDWWGRKPLLILGFFGAAFALLLFTLVAAFPDMGGWVAAASVNLFFLFVSLGVGGVPFVLLPELSPTKSVSSISSIAVCAGLVTTFLVALLTPPWIRATSSWLVFMTYTIICVVAGVFCIWEVPETKGKTLEEVQLYFEKRKEEKTKDT